jgi:cobalt-precorrin-5B (C1)-methyltransferase
VAGSEVDLDLLADIALATGATGALASEIRAANTARHVLELCRDAGLLGFAPLICERVALQLQRRAGDALAICVNLVDFGGPLLGRYPEAP